MAGIAPWLIPPDYIGAMSRGAGLGLQARQTDLSEEEQQIKHAEAGDRLRLAYDQLASEERRASAAAQAKLALSKSQLDLKAQQQAMLQNYRQANMARQIEDAQNKLEMGQQMFGLKQSQAEETARHNLENEKRFKAMEDRLQANPAIQNQRHILDAKKRHLQSKLSNPALFQAEVDDTKRFLEKAGIKNQDDEAVKASVRDNLNSIIEGLDKQAEGLTLKPSTTKTSNYVYKDGKIIPAEDLTSHEEE